jgi:hypothetical protein
MKPFWFVLAGVFCFQALYASDHIDGPVTTSHRVADLTDLFAFPTPHQANSLTIILDAYPLVPATGHFTDKVNYTIYIRKAGINGSAETSVFASSEETSIQCTFVTPELTEDHRVSCKTPNGLSSVNNYGVVTEQGGNDFRLYSGMRADPFFFNADFAQQAASGKLLPPQDKDTMERINVLTIVVEIDVGKLFKEPGSLFALAAETTTQDSPTAPLRSLDRVGRPEITNVSMVTHGEEADLRDAFNQERPFRVPAARQKNYQDRLFNNIGRYDGLDQKQNWQDSSRAALAQMLADDFLVVDIGKPCDGDQFFAIETALLSHQPYSTCGGRKLTDDIMDTLYTLYIGGLDGERVRDGVDHPHGEVQTAFPYLAEADLGFMAKAKAFLARKLLGVGS